MRIGTKYHSNSLDSPIYTNTLKASWKITNSVNYLNSTGSTINIDNSDKGAITLHIRSSGNPRARLLSHLNLVDNNAQIAGSTVNVSVIDQAYAGPFTLCISWDGYIFQVYINNQLALTNTGVIDTTFGKINTSTTYVSYFLGGFIFI